MAFYERGPQGSGDFEARHPPGAAGDPRQPALPVPARADAVDAARRPDLSHQRSRPGVAAVVLPLGHDARRRAAEGGDAAARCSTPAVFEKQVQRMLADPRSEALATRFASQWLRLQDVEKVRPDHHFYSYWDTTLSQAMVRETELFFDSLVREDRPVLDLLTADYTFVNERLAKHYGIPNILGNEFRRVHACRSEPPRHARAGQRAAADLDRRSHLAGAARQVGDGSAARLAAAAAAAERAGARGDQGGRRRQACCRRASAWKSTARTRRARRATG